MGSSTKKWGRGGRSSFVCKRRYIRILDSNRKLKLRAYAKVLLYPWTACSIDSLLYKLYTQEFRRTFALANYVDIGKTFDPEYSHPIFVRLTSSGAGNTKSPEAQKSQ